MTLFCMARSPLMIGADLLSTPKEIIDKYFKNDEILAIDQHSTDNRQVFKNKSYAIWTATVPETGERYIALFNLQDKLLPSLSIWNWNFYVASIRHAICGRSRTSVLWKENFCSVGSTRCHCIQTHKSKIIQKVISMKKSIFYLLVYSLLFTRYTPRPLFGREKGVLP